MEPAEPLIDTRALAAALGVSTKTVGRYRKSGLITPALVLPGDRPRYRLSEVERELRKGGQQVPRGES